MKLIKNISFTSKLFYLINEELDSISYFFLYYHITYFLRILIVFILQFNDTFQGYHFFIYDMSKELSEIIHKNYDRTMVY